MAVEYVAVDLPGKELYDKEFAVTVRKITPVEKNYLLTLSEKQQRTSKEYLDFIKSLVKISNEEMLFEDLYWADVQYILYRIRFTTYGKYPIKLQFTCSNPDCGETVYHNLDIGEMVAEEATKDQPRTVTLENLGEVAIYNKRVRDDVVIETFMKKHDISLENKHAFMLLATLCTISGEKSLEELYLLAESGEITLIDMLTIEKWIEENSNWGMEEKVNVVCPKCKKEDSRAYSLALEDYFSVI